VQAAGVVQQIALADIEPLTETDTSHFAHDALFAIGYERKYDMVSRLDIGYVGAHTFNDTGAFVAERDRRRIVDRPVYH